MDHNQTAPPNQPESSKIAPTAKAQRFGPVDTLRGFALLGILVPNIVVFSWPMMAMTDYTAMGDSPANQLGYTITATAFLGKFMFLFALLFGSGVIMYARKFDSRPGKILCKRCRYPLAGLPDDAPCPECNCDERLDMKPKLSEGAGLWYFRCGLLLAFGLLHAYGLWFGDILTFYAVAGLTLLWWIRRLDPKIQFWGGLVLYFLGSLITIGFAVLGYWAVSSGNMEINELAADPVIEIVGYTGTYFEAFKTRFLTVLVMQLFFIPLMLPMLWGIMSMGMGLTRMGILTGERSLGFYVKAAIICLTIGVTLTGGGFMFLYPTFDMVPGFIWQSCAQPLGIPLALGYGALVIALAKWAPAKIITTPLAAVGRMALTNYFLQTILCTTYFYGYGMGKFATIEYPQLWLVVFSVWGINIVFSMLWLRFFNMGPFEWLWRVMTYRQLVPIVRRPVHSDA